MGDDILRWLQEVGLDRYLPHTNDVLSDNWFEEPLVVGGGDRRGSGLDVDASNKIQEVYGDLNIKSLLAQDDGVNVIKAWFTLSLFKQFPADVNTGVHNGRVLCQSFQDRKICSKYGNLPNSGRCQWNTRWHMMSGSCEWVSQATNVVETDAYHPDREVPETPVALFPSNRLAVAGTVAATALNPLLGAATALGSYLYGKKYGTKVKQWKAELQKKPESMIDTIWNLYTITSPRSEGDATPISLGKVSGQVPERSGLWIQDPQLRQRFEAFMTNMHGALATHLRALGGNDNPIHAIQQVRRQLKYVQEGQAGEKLSL
jgi:hypothetical protein